MSEEGTKVKTQPLKMKEPQILCNQPLTYKCQQNL